MTTVSIKTAYLGVDKLTPYPQNPRTITEADLQDLCHSIEEDPLYFETRPVICSDRTGHPVIIAGEKRWMAAKKLLLPQIPVAIIPNLVEEEERRILLKDNGSFGEWDWDLFREYGYSDLPVGEWGVDIPLAFGPEEEGFGNLDDSAIKRSLHERFVIPPFSILDTRQGYWQERKRSWLSLGIKSEESREDMKAMGSFAGSVPQYYTLKEKAEQKVKRKLTNKEFEESFLLDMLPKNSQLAFTSTGGMLSIFDPVLCEIAYRWFCPDGGLVLDPFAGGSVRGIVAGMLGCGYAGIELREEQVQSNRIQAERIIPEAKVAWHTGNSLQLDTIFTEKADMIFSCPPYFDLEVYSDNQDDLSNMSWDDFKLQYAEIIRKSVAALKDDSFACFVVGDIRDEKGLYRNFVGLTTECFENAGASLYNEIIMVNVAGSLPIRVAKQFNTSRKVGKCHQNVLVYYKGNPKTIRDKFKELDFSEEVINSVEAENELAI